MLSHTEAQELHELIGGAIEMLRAGEAPAIADLERARELAAIIVADSD